MGERGEGGPQHCIKYVNFITGWLDDVGLPQYKTEFSQALIDGRVLNYLTVVCTSLLNYL